VNNYPGKAASSVDINLVDGVEDEVSYRLKTLWINLSRVFNLVDFLLLQAPTRYREDQLGGLKLNLDGLGGFGLTRARKIPNRSHIGRRLLLTAQVSCQSPRTIHVREFAN